MLLFSFSWSALVIMYRLSSSQLSRLPSLNCMLCPTGISPNSFSHTSRCLSLNMFGSSVLFDVTILCYALVAYRLMIVWCITFFKPCFCCLGYCFRCHILGLFLAALFGGTVFFFRVVWEEGVSNWSSNCHEHCSTPAKCAGRWLAIGLHVSAGQPSGTATGDALVSSGQRVAGALAQGRVECTAFSLVIVNEKMLIPLAGPANNKEEPAANALKMKT